VVLFIELVAKKTGNEKFSNVLDKFDYNPNLSLVRRFHTDKIVKMCQFYSYNSRFFLQPIVQYLLYFLYFYFVLAIIINVCCIR
jgi:hypothetical protein